MKIPTFRKGITTTNRSRSYLAWMMWELDFSGIVEIKDKEKLKNFLDHMALRVKMEKERLY